MPGDKNLYGQKDELQSIARWVERSNTHSDAPIAKAPSSEGSGELPDATQRSQDPGSLDELPKGG